HGLRVVKVMLPGRRVARFTHRHGRLEITPKVPIAAGTEFTVLVTYQGNPRPVRDRAGTTGWEELADGVIVAGQPGGAPSWFPCNDRPDNKATYRVSLAAASDYHVLVNGSLIDRRRHASATTWVYEVAEPMASYLATVQIGRYVETTLDDGSIPL